MMSMLRVTSFALVAFVGLAACGGLRRTAAPDHADGAYDVGRSREACLAFAVKSCRLGVLEFAHDGQQRQCSFACVDRTAAGARE
jgi:hypothetical protein